MEIGYEEVRGRFRKAILIMKALLHKALIFWLSACTLAFLFSLLLAPNHTVSFDEDNLVILTLEIVACAVVVVWSFSGIIRYFIRLRQKRAR